MYTTHSHALNFDELFAVDAFYVFETVSGGDNVRTSQKNGLEATLSSHLIDTRGYFIVTPY